MAECSDVEVHMVKNDILKEFIDVTMATESTAIQYLDTSAWDITKALDSYFSSVLNNSGSGVEDSINGRGTTGNPIVIDDSPVGKNSSGGSKVDSEQNRDFRVDSLKLLTWNVDGLCEHQLMERTRYVCELINMRQQDVVFLQEVIDETLIAFQRRCKGFLTLFGKHASGYYNAIMLRSQTTKQSGTLDEVQFTTSSMGRHLLIQPALFNQQIKLVLMTSHLESTAKCKQERKKQLEIVFNKMLSQDPEYTVIFGGDTNLRDIEITQVGVPDVISDVWEECGKEDTKCTWDVSVNDNLHWPYPNKPKLRFDRVYVRPGQGNSKIVPLEFSLVGKQRLASGCFPSDHWGIWCRLEKTA